MQLRWLEQSENDLPGGDDWLCPAERSVLAALRLPKRRADWRLGRWTAKCAVAASLDGPRAFSEIEIRAGPSGAPEVFCSGSPVPLAISLSHRAGQACCALADGCVRLGCDLELIEPHSQEFVEDYFTSEERRFLANTAQSVRSLAVAMLWSAKESALKALRVGLRAGTYSVVVTVPSMPPGPGDVWRPLSVRHSSGEFSGSWLASGPFVRTVVAAQEEQERVTGDSLLPASSACAPLDGFALPPCWLSRPTISVRR